MGANRKLSSDQIRAAFSMSMSTMYREEVPAYGTLLDIVARVNGEVLDRNFALKAQLRQTDSLERISSERHGAIRVGTGAELSMIRRIFAVMGMQAVGYYDLSVAGVPVHSTAFRPVAADALSVNPFRVFASLLRLDLIADQELQNEAQQILNARNIFTHDAVNLTERAELEGGLSEDATAHFINEVLETFRWHRQANVDLTFYRRLHDAHRLVADVVSFRGPHINHLTPRTLDIDRVQKLMPDYDIVPKAVIEGPPVRRCPILLRQTSFKALQEPVVFPDNDGIFKEGSHTARFGEIEQRGIALTPKGRGLYDRLLAEVKKRVSLLADGSNAHEYGAALSLVFEDFPDDWAEIRRQGLGYFHYSLVGNAAGETWNETPTLDELISRSLVRFDPITYEDFLPVSAAGIFQSNLGDGTKEVIAVSPDQKAFEDALGCSVLNEFDHYASIEKASIDACLATFDQLFAAE